MADKPKPNDQGAADAPAVPVEDWIPGPVSDSADYLDGPDIEYDGDNHADGELPDDFGPFGPDAPNPKEKPNGG